MEQQSYLNQLEKDIQHFIALAKSQQSIDLHHLTQRADDKAWNVLECYEHLNRYGVPYLGYIEAAISKGKARKTGAIMRSGWLGGYSARSMQTTTTGVKMPMKTFKSKNPFGAELHPTVIDRFIKQQEQLIPLLHRAKEIDLNKTRCKIDLPVITFKLGDALAFYTNHIARHLKQAERILAKQ